MEEVSSDWKRPVFPLSDTGRIDPPGDESIATDKARTDDIATGTARKPLAVGESLVLSDPTEQQFPRNAAESC
jgi:hypothetical protein